MANRPTTRALTGSLEDYLETIYELVRTKRFARVKDIARARAVRPGSVSPAMKRLAELGLIEYVRREYISLTAAGEERARSIVARHDLLCRLFEDVLKMERTAAEAEACAMEHSLTDEAMDRLVRFFEFLQVCPDAGTVLEKFHQCRVVGDDDGGTCQERCSARRRAGARGEANLRLGELTPGDRGVVTHVAGQGPVRQRLLDMGFMPDVEAAVDRVDARTGAVWIRLGGFDFSLTPEEADAVMVRRAET
jgi:DtxR family Mn-dependent transcriptional regulator